MRSDVSSGQFPQSLQHVVSAERLLVWIMIPKVRVVGHLECPLKRPGDGVSPPKIPQRITILELDDTGSHIVPQMVRK
jgi:hypothetical protein